LRSAAKYRTPKLIGSTEEQKEWEREKEKKKGENRTTVSGDWKRQKSRERTREDQRWSLVNQRPRKKKNTEKRERE
jgi:hypothetical protein